jgi:hypothetical protein
VELVAVLSAGCFALPAFDNFKDDRYTAAARAAFAAGKYATIKLFVYILNRKSSLIPGLLLVDL